jgi:uncharacterized membrane protein
MQLDSTMFIALAALLIGIAAGLRSMMPLAAITIANARGMLPLTNTVFAFLEHTWWSVIASAFALAELVGDKLPSTRSRKSPAPFLARLVSGAACGAIMGASRGTLLFGAFAGAIGAIIGTFAGHAGRRRLAQQLKHDLPAALIEDVVAIALCVLAVSITTAA